MDFSKLTEYLNSLQAEYGVPGTDIIIQQNHETIYRHTTGYSDYERTVPVCADDIYFFFSATKVVTMTAVLQLIERGLVGLYDPLAKYLPEYANMQVMNRPFSVDAFPLRTLPQIDEPTHFAARQIRIIDCMSMMAGFTYQIDAPAIVDEVKTNPNATTRDVVRAYAAMPLMYEPGEYWAYSLAHDVLAAVVETVTGKQYSRYLRESIFDPLGMADIFFTLPAGKEEKIAAFYIKDRETGTIRKNEKKNIFKLSERYESGGAGLMGNVDSYSKLVDALANGGVGKNGNRILSEKSVAMFTHSVVSGKALDLFHWGGRHAYSYGLGVRVRIGQDDGCKAPIGEFGWDGAAGAYVLVDTANRLSVFFAMHIMGFDEAFRLIHPEICRLVYDAVNDEQKKGEEPCSC